MSTQVHRKWCACVCWLRRASHLPDVACSPHIWGSSISRHRPRLKLWFHVSWTFLLSCSPSEVTLPDVVRPPGECHRPLLRRRCIYMFEKTKLTGRYLVTKDHQYLSDGLSRKKPERPSHSMNSSVCSRVCVVCGAQQQSWEVCW